MSALFRKLLRDLWQQRSEALAIALVMAAGIATFVLARSSFHSLQEARDNYYRQYRFADVFVQLERAPLSLQPELEQIPGVSVAETRVVQEVLLDLPSLDEPAVARLVSVPEQGRPRLNDMALRRGRWIEPGESDEVIVHEPFALAHGLEPGDSLTAVIFGTRRTLRVVGWGLSPEYVYTIHGASIMPDEKRFGILWMGRSALATAVDMEGAFNDVTFDLAADASLPAVMERIDGALELYGGLGSLPRALQTSNWYVQNEITGLDGSSRAVPMVFLMVAAFLLNVVLSRMVAVQRQQVAALKALGYSRWAVGWHYAQWALAVATFGAVVGIALGSWLGAGITQIYGRFYSFPELSFGLPSQVAVGAVAVTTLAALLGAAAAVASAVRLQPAEAMRPEAPASYRPTLLERAGLGRLLSPTLRMTLRNLERRPIRSTLTLIGLCYASAIMVVGTFTIDSLDKVMDLQFRAAQRQDLLVSFYLPASPRARYELQRVPGVLAVEPQRAVATRMDCGQRSRYVAITGRQQGASLQRVVDEHYRAVDPPAGGLLLSEQLATLLGCSTGATVGVQVLEGERPYREIPVTAVVREFMGVNAYMELGALHRLMGEDRVLSSAALAVDSASENEVFQRLKDTPLVAAVTLKSAILKSFQDTVQQNLGAMMAFNLLFASVIAFGVVYNSARVTLSERSRELASLRVMGFTRAEISRILLGELGLLVAVSLPLGLLLGRSLSAATLQFFNNELYRLPLLITPETYARAALTVIAAAVISGFTVRRRVRRLDLVAVLKTRE
ncbi:MAG: FtsX-like permease family protein [Acidobacteriota bacterium]